MQKDLLKRPPENLYDLFRSRFPADLRQPFLALEDGRSWSYADLHGGSGRMARLLLELGVRPGDRVAVQVEKSPEALLLYLAALRAGAVYLPLNPGYTPSEVSYFLGDAEPAVVVCDPAAEETVGALARRVGVKSVLTLGSGGEGSFVEKSCGQGGEFATVPVAPSDLAAILYTSGTTGRSKGAMLSHANLAANGLSLRDYWGFGEGDVLLHALPLFHAHGLFVAIHCTLLAGARIVFLPRFDVDRVVEGLRGATVFMGVPTYYTRLLGDARLDRDLCAGMRLFVSGSAPLLAETHRSFRERTGHAILERYGMTETGMNTSNPLHGDRVAGSVGPPLPGVEARVADADGRELPRGEIGVLEVRGTNVFSGYWRMPEKTGKEFRADGFFVTGDLARVDERGYVWLVGRARDLIITGGLNVYPKEVEGVLDRIAGVAESAVIGVPHPDFGEAVVAVVKRDSGSSDVTEETIIAAAKRQLAGYKTPKRVLFTDELPRNAMGKVQKSLLEDRHQELFRAKG